MYIVLAITRDKRTSAVAWGEYSEGLRYSACQFAKDFGWTVYYETAITSEEAVKAVIEKHETTERDMTKERVAEWLRSKVDTSDVRPVKLNIYNRYWEGASYIQDGERRYYLVGTRPRHKSKVCYHIRIDDPENSAKSWYEKHEWYVGGYIETPKNTSHPFGSNWILVPWTIEGDPDSRIDDYEEEYSRVVVDLEES